MATTRSPSSTFMSRDALRVAAGLADLADLGAQRLPAVGHQHHLVARADQGDADHRAVALAGVDEDDALAAAALQAELLERRALAVAALADGEHAMALAVADTPMPTTTGRPPSSSIAFHAHGGAAHGAHLVLGEADRHPAPGGDDDLARAVGDGGGEELVALLDLHADDALLAEVLVLGERGLLDLAALA